MGRAKEIVIKVIPAKIANDFVRRVHYSGKVVPNSCLHFGCFLDGDLHGVMQYGPSLRKDKILELVKGTNWNEFIELNRMAFDDYLPRNSESYCISVSIRLIKKYAPQIKWIISFADATQCGDGTIYRAANFVLTGIKRGTQFYRLKNGDSFTSITIKMHGYSGQLSKVCSRELFNEIIGTSVGNEKKIDELMSRIGAIKLNGFSLRYIYFIDKSCKDKLTVPIIPFTEIDAMGAGMYKGINILREERHKKEI